MFISWNKLKFSPCKNSVKSSSITSTTCELSLDNDGSLMWNKPNNLVVLHGFLFVGCTQIFFTLYFKLPVKLFPTTSTTTTTTTTNNNPSDFSNVVSLFKGWIDHFSTEEITIKKFTFLLNKLNLNLFWWLQHETMKR